MWAADTDWQVATRVPGDPHLQCCTTQGKPRAHRRDPLTHHSTLAPWPVRFNSPMLLLTDPTRPLLPVPSQALGNPNSQRAPSHVISPGHYFLSLPPAADLSSQAPSLSLAAFLHPLSFHIDQREFFFAPLDVDLHLLSAPRFGVAFLNNSDSLRRRSLWSR